MYFPREEKQLNCREKSLRIITNFRIHPNTSGKVQRHLAVEFERQSLELESNLLLDNFIWLNLGSVCGICTEPVELRNSHMTSCSQY